MTIPQSPNVIPARIPFSLSLSFSSSLTFPFASSLLSHSAYLYRYPRAPSSPPPPPHPPTPVHFVRPPAKENIPRLSSQLLLSRIFHRRATRENGIEKRKSYHSDCRVDVLKVQSSAHVEDVSNVPIEEYIQYCVYRILEVSIGRSIYVYLRRICFRISCRLIKLAFNVNKFAIIYNQL